MQANFKLTLYWYGFTQNNNTKKQYEVNIWEREGERQKSEKEVVVAVETNISVLSQEIYFIKCSPKTMP